MISSPNWGSTKILFPVKECSPLAIEDVPEGFKARSLRTNGGIILPKWDVSSSSTSCVMAALGALTVHSFFEIVLAMQVKTETLSVVWLVMLKF